MSATITGRRIATAIVMASLVALAGCGQPGPGANETSPEAGTVASPGESPMDTPEESPMDTPEESPMDTPMDTPMASPTEDGGGIGMNETTTDGMGNETTESPFNETTTDGMGNETTTTDGGIFE